MQLEALVGVVTVDDRRALVRGEQALVFIPELEEAKISLCAEGICMCETNLEPGHPLCAAARDMRL